MGQDGEAEAAEVWAWMKKWMKMDLADGDDLSRVSGQLQSVEFCGFITKSFAESNIG